MTSQENMDIRFELEDEYFNLIQNLETNPIHLRI